MKPDVFFIPLKKNDDLKTIHERLNTLYIHAGFDDCIDRNDLVAVKIHFGEKNNTTHIPAKFLLPIISNIKKKNAKPFLTDTNVLYKSERSNAISHIELAEAHGFTISDCGAPVIIADGLRGDRETEVEINGKIFDKVSIATDAVASNALITLTHVTGHMGTGLGGALKNLGMGLASRKGKLRQHSSIKPWIESQKCTGCELCTVWCPAHAINMVENIAVIDQKTCIGCGECLTVCRFDAVKFDWRTSIQDLQKKIAEHALGAITYKNGKVAFFNFLTNVTRDCDCVGMKQTPIISDIGVLASKDPVAIDKATLDVIHSHCGKNLREMAHQHIDETIQLHHAQEIGLGNIDYNLVEII